MFNIEQNNRESNRLIKEVEEHRVSLPFISKANLESEVSPDGERVLVDQSAKKIRYPRSPLFEKIEKEDLLRKREEFIKAYEKKNKRKRQHEYSRKIRGDTKKTENNVFVT